MKGEIIRTALGVKNKDANATVSIPMPHISNARGACRRLLKHNSGRWLHLGAELKFH